MFREFKLLNTLINEGVLTENFHEEIMALPTSVERFDKMFSLLEEHLVNGCADYDPLDDEVSKELINLDNTNLSGAPLMESLARYTASVAIAKSPLVEAFGYLIRAATLFKLGMGNDSVTDLERAEDSGYSENLDHLKRHGYSMRECTLENPSEIPKILPGDRNNKVLSANKLIKMKYNRDYGRHYVATQTINPGEVMMVEEPFAVVINLFNKFHCHSCYEVCYHPIPCKKCTARFYCDEDCMGDDAAYHLYECLIIRRIAVTNYDMLAFKMTYLMKNNLGNMKSFRSKRNVYSAKRKCSPDSLYQSCRYNEVFNLHHQINTTDSVKLVKQILFPAVQIFYVLRSFSDFFDNVEDESSKKLRDFKRIMMINRAIVQINAIFISEMINNSLGGFISNFYGLGIYSAFSIFNHACNHNVRKVTFGISSVVYSTRTIQKGEQCYVNYGVTYEDHPKLERQILLYKQLGFLCLCVACVENWPKSNKNGFQNNENTFLLFVRTSNNVDFIRRSIMDCGMLLKFIEITAPSENYTVAFHVYNYCLQMMGNIRAIRERDNQL